MVRKELNVDLSVILVYSVGTHSLLSLVEGFNLENRMCSAMVLPVYICDFQPLTHPSSA